MGIRDHKVVLVVDFQVLVAVEDVVLYKIQCNVMQGLHNSAVEYPFQQSLKMVVNHGKSTILILTFEKRC